MKANEILSKQTISNLALLGERYCRRYLADWRRDISENWWTAYDFFFNHAFMRGRRDQLSIEYFHFTINALKDYFSITNNPNENEFQKLVDAREKLVNGFNDIVTKKIELGMKLSANSLKNEEFMLWISERNSLIRRLVRKNDIQGQKSLNNDKDLLMVLSALTFLTRPEMPANIYNYFVCEIKSGNSRRVVEELRSIYAVGDKLSSFIVRDIILMNPDLPTESQSLAFPVDTWVLKIAKRLGCEANDPDSVRKFFVDQLGGASAVKVAAGLWYLGFHSFELLLENLDKIDLIGE